MEHGGLVVNCNCLIAITFPFSLFPFWVLAVWLSRPFQISGIGNDIQLPLALESMTLSAYFLIVYFYCLPYLIGWCVLIHWLGILILMWFFLTYSTFMLSPTGLGRSITREDQMEMIFVRQMCLISGLSSVIW